MATQKKDKRNVLKTNGSLMEVVREHSAICFTCIKLPTLQTDFTVCMTADFFSQVPNDLFYTSYRACKFEEKGHLGLGFVDFVN